MEENNTLVEENSTSTETKKKKSLSEKQLEIIIAIFLALTAFLTAWAGWIGSLHGGNQATNYANSNNVASDGNSRYNEAEQKIMQDMLLWNNISDLQMEILYADACLQEDPNNETYVDEKSLAAYKLYYLCVDNLSDEMAAHLAFDKEEAMAANDNATYMIDWLYNNSGASDVSPFADEEFINAYYEDAMAVIAQSEELLQEGKKDNANGDAFNLVTVIYSVVLFLLGICGTLKRLPNRTIIVFAAIAVFIFATVYMFTIPMPTGFSLGSFFSH